MPDAAPQVTIAKPGTIPIAAVNNAEKQQNSSQKDPSQRSPAAGKLKVVLRRLPPGLTQQELEAALGQDWLQGKGKVAWLRYVNGKVSKDAAKPSRPACCYLHLTAQPHLESLAAHVQTTTFHDAKNTSSDPVLIGGPTLDFALFQRVPASKKRNDARQGLIDQDPEFIEFLESLTNPVQKAQNVEALLKDEDGKDEKITTTPLIQHLREKKAAKEKAKENKGKAHGRNASKADADSKTDSKPASKDEKKSNDRSNRRGGKQDAQKKEPAAASPKPPTASPAKTDSKASAQANKKGTAATAGGAAAASAPTPSSPTPTAVRLIQRDLGIRGGRGGGRKQTGRAENKPTSNNETADTKAATQGPAAAKAGNSTAASNANSNATTAPAAPSAVLKRQSNSTSGSGQAQSSPKSATLANTSGTSAFLKHANPSQGITEPLIQTALSVFGPIKSVEIDKRKGFAFVEFGDSQSLAKAVGQGTVKVAQGNVLVLERKDRGNAAASSTNSANGPSASGNKPQPAAPAPAQPATAPAAMRAEATSRGGTANRFRGGGRGGRGGGGRGRGGANGGAAANQQANASTPPTAPTSSSAIKAGT